jgi:hypothetical protein
MNTIKFLRIVYIATLLVVLGIVFCYETNLLEPGMFADNARLNYEVELICLAQTIVCLPLALKIFHFKGIKAKIRDNEQAYRWWSLLRLALLWLPLITNTTFYYTQGEVPSLGYLALMLIVGYLFVWPSHGKMLYECQMDGTPTKEEA